MQFYIIPNIEAISYLHWNHVNKANEKTSTKKDQIMTDKLTISGGDLS